jgi:queuosine precursor transporter
MKVWTNGRFQGARFVGSTIAGEAVDSAIFYPLAFYNSGIMPNELVFQLTYMQFLVKTGVEIVFLPVTYRVVAFLKRAEQEDYYDRDTNFNPFHLEA